MSWQLMFYNIASLFLFFGILLSVIRFLKGPDALNRLVALDMIALSGQGLLGVFMIKTGDPLLIDIFLVWAILPFVGTAALTTLLMKRWIS